MVKPILNARHDSATPKSKCQAPKSWGPEFRARTIQKRTQLVPFDRAHRAHFGSQRRHHSSRGPSGIRDALSRRVVKQAKWAMSRGYRAAKSMMLERRTQTSTVRQASSAKRLRMGLDSKMPDGVRASRFRGGRLIQCRGRAFRSKTEWPSGRCRPLVLARLRLSSLRQRY